MNYGPLRDEVINDPLGRGYSGMTNKQVVKDLEKKYRTRNISSFSGSFVLNRIKKSEYDALSDADKDKVWQILHLNSINTFGVEAALFVDIFGAGSTTINNLSGARTESISRASELGLGKVYHRDVEKVRS